MAYLTRSQVLDAISAAHRVRLRAGYQAQEPVCVYDLAVKLGVEVRFIGGNSFGGMYSKDFEQILVPSKRPPGRQAYTCAHELGHWYFKHGSRIELIDEMDKGGFEDPEERIADLFANYLLMPKWAVEDAIRRRSLTPSRCTAIECYRLANQLGVGYTTLVKQLGRLHLIDTACTDVLLRATPKEIRREILGEASVTHLVIADSQWWRVPIDLSVGDALIVPSKSQLDGANLRSVGVTAQGLWLEARTPGIARVMVDDIGWSTYVRVARKQYTGRSKFRFLEDPDVNE